MHLTVNVCTYFYAIMHPELTLSPSFLGVDRKARSGKWVLFILPLVTVLREGPPLSIQKEGED